MKIAMILFLLATTLLPAATSQAAEALTLTQKMNAVIPADLTFRNEQGVETKLGSLFENDKPILLVPVYFTCPNLCDLTMDNLISGLNSTALKANEAYTVVMVSIDPHDTPEAAMKKKQRFMKKYRDPKSSPGWHYLTGSESTIKRLMSVIGFPYVYDPTLGQYNHPSAVVALTPSGHVSRYLFGLEYLARDLTFALMEASGGRIGTPLDRFLLFCFHYDPAQGRYGAKIMTILRILGVLAVLAIALLVMGLRRSEKKHALQAGDFQHG